MSHQNIFAICSLQKITNCWEGSVARFWENNINSYLVPWDSHHILRDNDGFSEMLLMEKNFLVILNFINRVPRCIYFKNSKNVIPKAQESGWTCRHAIFLYIFIKIAWWSVIYLEEFCSCQSRIVNKTKEKRVKTSDLGQKHGLKNVILFRSTQGSWTLFHTFTSYRFDNSCATVFPKLFKSVLFHRRVSHLSNFVLSGICENRSITFVWRLQKLWT